METIFAECSAKGKAGVTVFRISGPSSYASLQKLIQSNLSNMEARKMYFRKIYDPFNDDIIDEAMVVFFNDGASFTGEKVVEIFVHGSIAVVKKLYTALTKIDTLRLAEPGEFAKRAFLNGKFDLTAAEALADLIDAETELQHKQAIRQLGGGLERIYDSWRGELVKLIAFIEAYIDFPDEEIPDEALANCKKIIKDLILQIKVHLGDSRRGERLRTGIKLAIIGRPNVGKSSLLNYLMQREVAIVSGIAGTTRDVIEGHLDIGGYPIILQDTAGINEITEDLIEIEGIKRAKKVSLEADIKILMFDIAVAADIPWQDFAEIIDENTIILLNKIDLIDRPITDNIKGLTPILLSLKTQAGTKELLAEIERIAANLAEPGDLPAITRARHRAQLERAVESLKAVDFTGDLVLAAEDLRMTIRYLSNITGKITVDEILGEIFGNFCIGK